MKRTPFKPRKVGLKRTPMKRGTKRLKKVRLDSIGKLKVKLWQLCRAIIIQRYGSDCYTCPATNLVGSNRHVGHFISSSVCSAELRYALENLRPQCYACNIHRSGNWPSYEAHLIRDGIDVAALKQRNYDTKGMQADRLFYEEKIAAYQTLLSSLDTPQ